MTRAVGPTVPMAAGFLEGPNGSLFLLEYSPPPDVAARGTVLLLSPFAEEMNRSRRLMAELGRAMAMRGLNLFIPDLTGTGDSAGNLEDTDLERWQADIDFLCRHARAGHSGPLILSGIRFGALLAAGSAACARSEIDGLLLIEPVTNGARFLQQFLRLRIAAALGRGERETGGALMARLEAGEILSISGYPLAPAMARTIKAAALADCPPPAGLRTAWVEIASETAESGETRSRLPPSWQASEAVMVRRFTDRPFWTLPEPVAAPLLVAGIADLAAELVP
ncbi:MAG: hydrolase 2, exosortase A system-associated [Rhodothalassiaceae bacterium]